MTPGPLASSQSGLTKEDHRLQLAVGKDMRNKSYQTLNKKILNAEVFRIVMMIGIVLQVQRESSPQCFL